MTGISSGLKKAGFEPDFAFSPSGATIAAAPRNCIVIGESLRLYDEKNRSNGGFRAVLPSHNALKLKTPALQPGRYRVALSDTELPSTEHLQLIAGGKTLSGWQQSTYQARFPEENQFPPILMPWHWFPDKPWPLYKRPMRKNNIVRESTTHSISFELTEPTDALEIQNNGETLYLAGMITITNLDTKEEKVIDFYWGDENILKNDINLSHKDKTYPLLWTDPHGRPGRKYLFTLEKNFGDVKAFAYYKKASE